MSKTNSLEVSRHESRSIQNNKIGNSLEVSSHEVVESRSVHKPIKRQSRRKNDTRQRYKTKNEENTFFYDMGLRWIYIFGRAWIRPEATLVQPKWRSQKQIQGCYDLGYKARVLLKSLTIYEQ